MGKLEVNSGFYMKMFKTLNCADSLVKYYFQLSAVFRTLSHGQNSSILFYIVYIF